MFKSHFLFFVTVALSSLLFFSSCGSEADCDTKTPLAINFEIQEKDGQQVLVNLSEPACQIEKVSWDLDGDGAFDTTDESPTIPAGQPLGQVTLMINDLNEASKNFRNQEQQLELVVDFSIPITAKVGEEVAMVSYAEPESKIQNLLWTFGDDNSNSENEAKVYHTYTSPGTYTVELCVNYENCKTAEIVIEKAENIAGLTKKSGEIKPKLSSQEEGKKELNNNFNNNTGGGSSSQPTYIPPPPVPEPFYTIRINMPLSGEVGEQIVFKDNSKATNGTIESYTWYINGTKKSGNTSTIQHQFSNPGDYQVKLCVNNGIKCTTDNIRIKEKYIPPVYQANFSEPSSINVGQVATFRNESKANVTISSYTWSINNKLVSSQKNLTHTFSTAGSFKVKLCVDNNTCNTKTITVNEPEPDEPPVYQPIFIVPNSINVGQVTTFRNESTANVTIRSHTWSINNKPVSSEKNLTHTFSTAGSFEVKLCIDNNSCDIKVITVNEPKPDEGGGNKSVVIPDDDFYPTNISGTIGKYEDCSTAKWVSSGVMTFEAKQKLVLQKAIVYSNSDGKIQVKLAYNNNGITEEVPLTRRVNAGRSEILLNKLNTTLYPGITYTLLISNITEGLEIKSNSSCKKGSNSDSRLSINHKSGFTLFELQYKY